MAGKKKKSSLDNLIYDFLNKTVVKKRDKHAVSNDGKKRGIIYARVSTGEQRDKGNGINGQIVDCEIRAKTHDAIIVKTFKDEGISGTKLDRKDFNDALKFVEDTNKRKDTPPIDYFICSSTSRFSRNKDLGKNMELIKRLNDVGAEFVAVGNGGIQEIDTETGYLQYTMQSMMDALESIRGSVRVKIGYRGKLMAGIRPFPGVPAGYKPKVENIGGKPTRILIKDEEMAPIIKDGLEGFALGKILTKTDLFNYFDERGLKSNSKVNKTGKFYLSDIDKMLQPRKLFFYAGYMIYPEYGIETPTKSQRAPIIDLDIADKILRRLDAYKKGPTFTKRKYDEDADEYPLKRILLCPECNKPMTKRKSKSKTGAYHPYYGCNTKGCKLYRKACARDVVHDAVRDKISEYALDESLRPFFDALFQDEWNIEKGDMQKARALKRKEIADIQKQMDKIEASIDEIHNSALKQKKELAWAELNVKKEELEYSLEDENFDKTEFEHVYNDAKVTLFNPALIRDMGDAETKQLLIRVLFGGKIYYSKNQGCKTPEVASLYLLFKDLNKSKIVTTGGNSKNVKLYKGRILNNRDIFERISILLSMKGITASSIFS